MNKNNRVTLYVQVLIVSLIIPTFTFVLYSVYGNDFNISLLVGVMASILVSMSILALRAK